MSVISTAICISKKSEMDERSFFYFYFFSRRVLTFVYSGTESPVGVSGSACLLHVFHVSISMRVWMNKVSRL